MVTGERAAAVKRFEVRADIPATGVRAGDMSVLGPWGKISHVANGWIDHLADARGDFFFYTVCRFRISFSSS